MRTCEIKRSVRARVYVRVYVCVACVYVDVCVNLRRGDDSDDAYPKNCSLILHTQHIDCS